MKKIKKQGDVLYKTPQVLIVGIEPIQPLASSNSSIIDDMTESWGSWENDITSLN